MAIEKEQSPLSEAMEAIGLRQSDLAARLGVSQVSVSRWCKGERAAPRAAFLALGLDTGAELEREHRRWLREHKGGRHGDAFLVEAILPPGVTPEQARAAALGAIGRLAEAAKP